MAEVLAGLVLTESVVAALQLASASRTNGQLLDTQTLLLAIESTTATDDWSRLLTSLVPQEESTNPSAFTWHNVALTWHCGEALARFRKMAEAYKLIPAPPAVLVLALVWDAGSAASRSIVGLTHDEIVNHVQQDLLGTRLTGLPELVTAPPAHHHVARLRVVDQEDPADALTAEQAAAALRRSRVTTALPLWLFRALTLAALAGVVLGLMTSSAWNFEAHDDLAPPNPRPVVAGAIPDDGRISTILGGEVVRVHDGLPLDTRLFDSMAPFWYDQRTQTVNGAWSAHWIAPNGRTDGNVTLVRSTLVRPISMDFVTCSPKGFDATKATAADPRSGYARRSATGAEFCSQDFTKQTQVFVSFVSADPAVMDRLPTIVTAVHDAVVAALPESDFPLINTVPTPYATAQINRGLLLAAIGLPVLWTVPTLLFDRATWQRLFGTIGYGLFRRRRTPRLDVDRAVRVRLWSAMAVLALQVCAAVWTLRLTTRQGVFVTGTSVVAVVLLISLFPRIAHLRRVGGSAAFQGGRRVFWVVGTLVGVAGVLFALFLMWTANAASAFGGVADEPDYELARLSVLVQLLSIPFALLAIGPSMFLRRIAMRLLRKKRSADTRDPILLLRSFADDRRRLRARSSHRRALVDRVGLRRFERFEEVIAASLAVHGPVYAIGQVGERLPPPLGAVRRQLSNDEWQHYIQVMMNDAAIVCVTVGRSTALDWEIRRIAHLGLLAKTIFVLPPTSRREHTKRLAVLAAALDLSWADLETPRADGWVLAVRVDTPGARPQVVRARAQEDVGYEIAIELARLVLADDVLRLPAQRPSAAPAPAPEVYPPGKTPVFKPVTRRKAFWLPVLLSATSLIKLPIAFASGETEDASSRLSINSDYSWWATAADPYGTSMFGIVEGNYLARMDFEHDTTSKVCTITIATSLIADHGWVFASNRIDGTLEAVDTGAGRVVWTLHDLPGVRGVVATGDRIYFVLPSLHEVRAVDRRTGEQRATQKLDGVPWAAAVDGDHLAVSVISSYSVVNLALDLDEEPVPYMLHQQVSDLAVANGTVWAYLPREHLVLAIDGPLSGAKVLTRSQRPHIASNGTVLAIEGVEVMTTIWPDGSMRRSRLSTRHSDSLAVTGAGDVLSTMNHDALLIHPQAR